MDKLHSRERLRDQANRDQSATSADALPSVGKQTLTEQLAPSASADREAAPVQMRSMWSQIPFGGGPVQMRASAKETAANDITHGAAQHAISGSGGPLPFLDAIQRAFGHHDVSGVRAHTDGNAAQGARAMGAEAFASGNHVAFAGTPSLHTAAHEAAHVIQQRAGVHLKGGVGEAGDSYEQPRPA